MTGAGSRAVLAVVSIAAHVAMAAGLSALPARRHTETIAISFSESKPKRSREETMPVAPDPITAPKITTVTKPAKNKPSVDAKAPLPTSANPPPPNANATPNLSALPDFGVSLSGGGGGLAVSGGGGGAPSNGNDPAPKVVTKTLAKPSTTADECSEPPAKPKLVSRPSPAYTDDARAAGIEGKVRVEISVDETGRVTAVRVLAGLGHGLDEAAIAAAKSASFEPALHCGKAVSATFKIAFNFAP